MKVADSRAFAFASPIAFASDPIEARVTDLPESARARTLHLDSIVTSISEPLTIDEPRFPSQLASDLFLGE